MTKEEKKDELKNRISMALKDPTLQPSFEIICKNLAELEKENERLKGDLELWESGGCRATNLFECGVVKELKEQLTKVREIISAFVEWANWEGANCPNFKDIQSKAEQFLKEIEK